MVMGFISLRIGLQFYFRCLQPLRFFRLCWVGTFIHIVTRDVQIHYIQNLICGHFIPMLFEPPEFSYAMPTVICHRYWMDWYERRKNLILGGHLGDMWPEMVMRLATHFGGRSKVDAKIYGKHFGGNDLPCLIMTRALSVWVGVL